MTDYLTISSCYYSLGCDGRAPTAPDTPGLILSQSPPSEQRGEERSLRTLHLVKSREQSSVLTRCHPSTQEFMDFIITFARYELFKMFQKRVNTFSK